MGTPIIYVVSTFYYEYYANPVLAVIYNYFFSMEWINNLRVAESIASSGKLNSS